jgi:hypothetical protein
MAGVPLIERIKDYKMNKVIGFALFVVTFLAQATTVGTLPGELTVDQGVAQYQIPLDLPTGRGGNTPQLSLIYSSQGGTGGRVTA